MPDQPLRNKGRMGGPDYWLDTVVMRRFDNSVGVDDISRTVEAAG